MRSTVPAAAALTALLAGCTNGSPTPTPPPATTETTTVAATPGPTGDAATIAAVKTYATDLRTADATIKGCATDATPACASAATDTAAPAAAALGTALGQAPGETATVMAAVPLLAAAVAEVVKDIRDYQGSPTADRWRQVVLASGGVVQILDTDWARYGI